jgi:hypothetical protein
MPKLNTGIEYISRIIGNIYRAGISLCIANVISLTHAINGKIRIKKAKLVIRGVGTVIESKVLTRLPEPKTLSCETCGI